MRLLHSKTMRLHEVVGAVPPYAILSHTWEDEEVPFNLIESDVAKSMKGYKKIEYCCNAAAADGFAFVWADTCCIDKSSSAELSEAINSMYQWYKKAQVCYVYLSDVHMRHSGQALWEQFRDCRWLTRGWTLQELLAPSSIIFMSNDWQEIGTNVTLANTLAGFTGIHKSALLGANLENFSIAQRMSWASRRMTTRVEDLAYCLLGLFDINMPMLYGEGDRAFIRLQEEIIKKSDDHSIFAWRSRTPNYGGLLAPNPAAFRKSQNVVRSRTSAPVPYSVTNKGVQLSVRVVKTDISGTEMAILDCYRAEDPEELIALEIIPAPGLRQYVRKQWLLTQKNKASLEELTANDSLSWEDIFVREGFHGIAEPQNTDAYCQLRITSAQSYPIKLLDAYPTSWIEKHKYGTSQRMSKASVADTLRLATQHDDFLVVLQYDDGVLRGAFHETHGSPLREYFRDSAYQCSFCGKGACEEGSDRIFRASASSPEGISVSIRKVCRNGTQPEFVVHVEWKPNHVQPWF